MPALVIASGNPHKVAEISAMLDVVDLEVRDPPIEELIGALFRRPDSAADATDRS